MRRAWALVLAAALLGPATAAARSYTPDLGAFYRLCPAGATCPTSPYYVDLDAFKSFAGELGVALAPKMVGPAASLGSAGFEVSAVVGLTDFNGGADYWAGDASKGWLPVVQNPGKLLVTNQFRVRKGLPYSFQVGGIVTHLDQSDLWAIGVELGWSFVEGFKYSPDISVNASVSTVLGCDDLAMLQMAGTALLSKSFSVAGLFTLEPYAGYTLIWVNVSTHLTSTFPVEDPKSGRRAGNPVEFAIGLHNVLNHRGVIGLNAVMSWVTAGFEATIGPDQRTYAFKLGAQF